MKKKKYLVKDTIIKHGKVFSIFKVKKNNGNDIIFFRPVFIDKGKEALTGSIPVKSINENYIRRPLTKKGLKELIEDVFQGKRKQKRLRLSTAKAMLLKNGLKDNFEILKQLWLEKHDKSLSFPSSRSIVLRNTIRKSAEEWAFVKGMSVEKAKEDIIKTLEKCFNS